MTKSILIVEDNELNMKLIDDVLRAHGYATFQSKDGRDVFSLADDYRPDLILMDIQLPKISGLEITKTIALNLPAARSEPLTYQLPHT